ncbi:hypothetical protein PtrM4_012170 [Pyrenophora tritici-repentis]|uniref:Uncharacterized protein n=1 Tax=Pyrenophora tritici-repentis TaxID=45151 RepID=A0A834SB98_9PLEO|nr:hypothetical protein PtrM4_012170 [Pyrenophora tritici-repentis]
MPHILQAVPQTAVRPTIAIAVDYVLGLSVNGTSESDWVLRVRGCCNLPMKQTCSGYRYDENHVAAAVPPACGTDHARTREACTCTCEMDHRLVIYMYPLPAWEPSQLVHRRGAVFAAIANPLTTLGQ